MDRSFFRPVNSYSDNQSNSSVSKTYGERMIPPRTPYVKIKVWTEIPSSFLWLKEMQRQSVDSTKLHGATLSKSPTVRLTRQGKARYWCSDVLVHEERKQRTAGAMLKKMQQDESPRPIFSFPDFLEARLKYSYIVKILLFYCSIRHFRSCSGVLSTGITHRCFIIIIIIIIIIIQSFYRYKTLENI